MTDFEILPAIDLLGGKVVRLVRGEFDAATAYSDDPTAVALDFVGQGARWLHVVDLDAARTGSPVNREPISRLIDTTGQRVRCEVAGGLRSEAAVEGALARGAARAVVGTAAIGDPGFAAGLVRAFGTEHIAVALDVRDDRAVGHGWTPGTDDEPLVEDVLASLVDVGVVTFEVTAIDRDGTLRGPDLGLLARLVAGTETRIIASAGIRSADDIRAVRDLGCAGVIVGRALYDGTLALTEALEAGAAPAI